MKVDLVQSRHSALSRVVLLELGWIISYLVDSRTAHSVLSTYAMCISHGVASQLRF